MGIREADCDSDCDVAVAPLPAPTTTSSSESVSASQSLQRLVLLQCFDGSWQLTEAVAAALGYGITLERITCDAGAPTTAWATALALAFLEIAVPDLEEEWDFVASKARNWLRQQLGSSEWLITKARDMLKAFQAEHLLILEAERVKAFASESAIKNDKQVLNSPGTCPQLSTQTRSKKPTGMVNYE